MGGHRRSRPSRPWPIPRRCARRFGDRALRRRGSLPPSRDGRGSVRRAPRTSRRDRSRSWRRRRGEGAAVRGPERSDGGDPPRSSRWLAVVSSDAGFGQRDRNRRAGVVSVANDDAAFQLLDGTSPIVRGDVPSFDPRTVTETIIRTVQMSYCD